MSRGQESVDDEPGIRPPTPLQGLETVLVDPGDRRGPEVDLHDILPLTGLPSIHTLQVHQLVDKTDSQRNERS